MSTRRTLALRTRLALQFAGAVALLVLVFAGAVWLFARASMREQLDARVHEDFEAVEHGFEVGADGGLAWSSTVPDDERPSEAPWAEILHVDGRILLVRPAGGRPAGGPWAVEEHAYEKQGVSYVLRVGRSESPLRHELRELLLLLAVCLLPVVALAFLAGRWLAGRALAPVAAMTERARAISAERLSERLPVANPGDDLGRLATVFNEAFARLERSFEGLRRFTADASHELRTPLTTLRSVGEVALREPLHAEGLRDAIGSMLEECDRLARLVDDLLSLARSDAGKAPPATEAITLAELARAAVAQLGVLAEEKQQRLEVEVAGPSAVRADPRLLLRAVVNLVHNANRYAPAGSTITVRTGGAGAEAFLEVVDQGPGIAPEHQALVFERFYRVDAARQGAGVGLGLSIARRAVEAHGGRIELVSRPGAGCTFRIVLPAADTTS